MCQGKNTRCAIGPGVRRWYDDVMYNANNEVKKAQSVCWHQVCDAGVVLCYVQGVCDRVCCKLKS